MKSAAIFQTDLSGNAAVMQSSQTKSITQVSTGTAFSFLMNQTGKTNQMMSQIATKKTQAGADSFQTDTQSAAQVAYDRQTASTAGTSVKEADAPKDSLTPDEQTAVEEAVDEIREAVKDIYDTTDEAIDAAMQAAQIMMADLLTPNGINTLIGELTQSDNPFEVLMTDTFDELSDVQQQIMTELSGQLGLSDGQITELYGQSQQMADILPESLPSAENTGAPDVIALMEPVSEEEAAALTQQVQMMQNAKAPADDSVGSITVESMTAETVPDTAISGQSQAVVTETLRTEPEEQTTKSSQAVSSDLETIPETVSEAEIAAEDENAGENQNLSEETFNQTTEEEEASAGESIRKDVRQAEGQSNMTQRTDTPVVTTSTVTTVNADGTQTIIQTETLRYSDVDVESLMRQITTEASVQITDEHSMMTMQLEPENLGRLTLQVMAKGSAVTAQIIAENEAVKHAIEANVSTLQENLAHNGLKVEAVEVTVESHAFDQNLEQGAGTGAQAQQQQEQSSQQSSVRHGLYLNELDELSGLLSEEELLAAQIMSDNGNTMDVSA